MVTQVPQVLGREAVLLLSVTTKILLLIKMIVNNFFQISKPITLTLTSLGLNPVMKAMFS
jgi:hypothetical protein